MGLAFFQRIHYNVSLETVYKETIHIETVFLQTKKGDEKMSASTELFMGIRSLFRLYDKMLKRVYTEYNLTVIETDVISFLQNNPEKDTAADIVELRMLSKGAVSKAVESLIQKSILERRPDTEDRRKIHLRLMPQARPVTDSIDQVREEFLTTILDGFTKEELEMHKQFYCRLFQNTKKAMEKGSERS